MSENFETEKPVNSENRELSTSEEYAYLDRGGFSSEKFKIEIRGLPKFYGIVELKKLMNQKLGLNASKIKRPKNGSHWLFACFQNNEDRAKAIATLDGYCWKGKKLITEEAKPAPDPLVRKRKKDENPVQSKKKKEDENKSQDERLKDAVTPYWNIPYEEQLKLKEKEVKNLLMKFDNEIWKINKDKRKVIENNRKLYDGLSFELKPIQKSPITEGYRNKCEFTVGIDEETQKPTVGFRLGSYVTGTVGVAPVTSLSHISEKTKRAVLLFQDFVCKSDMSPFSPADYSGYWRYLTVRESTHNGDLMLIVAMHPQDLSKEKLEEVKNQLIEHYSSDEAKSCGIKSLYFELITKKRSGEDGSKPIHLMNETHIIDTILGQQFRISPEAFFQINTAGADILYQSAIELSVVNKESTIIDICCGTGTIGLCFAKHVDKVLGLELVPEAVQDAKYNAKLNNIDNCSFFTGKAEDVLPSVLARATSKDVVAIVDPPRAGLHMRAVTQLRNSKKVSRLIYISCSPASAIKNFIDLSRPSSKTLRGAPFVPVQAVLVDMFPNTRHVELAVLFEREVTPSDEDKETNVDKGDGDKETNVDKGDGDKETNVDKGDGDKETNVDKGDGDKETNVDKGDGDKETNVDKGDGDKETNVDKGDGDKETNVDKGDEDKETNVDKGDGDKETNVDKGDVGKEKKINEGDDDKETNVNKEIEDKERKINQGDQDKETNVKKENEDNKRKINERDETNVKKENEVKRRKVNEGDEEIESNLNKKESDIKVISEEKSEMDIQENSINLNDNVQT